VEYTPHT